ncbi:glycosyl hydrolase 115 family protein [Proteiniphilum saccharofermentans]|uniref:glycosyl hydrolase 115 family protein n=1 Tax=Proteiniphilum saccharofermentans TaxID=1642647 RepID=UPI0028A7FA1A|nr:glycosyl hydrolase 115 family protein [Proteiniphilum saccharofermentans]
MKKSILLSIFVLFAVFAFSQPEMIVDFQKNDDVFPLVEEAKSVSFLIDPSEDKGILRAIHDLQSDVEKVTGITPEMIHTADVPDMLVIGSIENNRWIKRLWEDGKLNGADLAGKREKYIITTVRDPFPGVREALIIAGSDKRGTIYGLYELSEQIGVSPWYYWADVPVERRENIYIKRGTYTDGEPAVRYRGIFLNDEAPALSGWAHHTFGGFNHQFYEKVFELILRLKGNFLWPAMWGNAFYDDDPENGALADEMGIVIGTSHHEPLGRAHDEWRRYGSGAWNYQANAPVLRDFWKGGMERMKDFETIVTVGMRGDGDEPMSEESNIALLEEIIGDQRKIISDVTGEKAEQTPQVWALYKEVQDYYDKGMRVPDDITLLLCDDNWGNVRKLPHPDAPERAGGYGMYYHFDYVGGPRNYKWINVTQVQRLWEQMNLTYSHGVDRIWVVNVGDLKPMEYPISFFLDMAWDPTRFNASNLLQHTEEWCAQQFGEKYAEEAARLINLYTKYNRRVTPELLNDTIYSLENYNEFERVVTGYRDLVIDAMRLYYLMPDAYKDAFDQLVLFPINACSNLYEMYFAVAKNKHYARRQDIRANYWGDKVAACFERDSVLTHHYNNVIANGKWAHMMDQVRIGYTYWQQPEKSVMPEVVYVEEADLPASKVFIEKEGYISIEAQNFARSQGTDRIQWEVIPGLGKTKSGVTTFPQNVYPEAGDAVYLEYDLETESSGELQLHILVSPTLNFNQNKGLRYAVSFNGGEETIVNINREYDVKQMEHWQANSINETVTRHTITQPGKQMLRFRVLDPAIVLQKIIINFGGLKESYLGPPESEFSYER